MNELFEPVPNILTWEIEEEHTRKELASYAEALDKLVSIGTHLLKWELEENTLSRDERGIVGVSFKRLLEILDSIALQVRVGSVTPAMVQLRVLFELSIQFEHLLKADTHRRCHCSMLTDWYRQLEALNKVAVLSRTNEESKAISRLQNLVDNKALSDIKDAYDGIRANKKSGEIKWYSLFNRNLSDLSKLVDSEFPKYKEHYKYINKGFGNDAVHSTNLLEGCISNCRLMWLA